MFLAMFLPLHCITNEDQNKELEFNMGRKHAQHEGSHIVLLQSLRLNACPNNRFQAESKVVIILHFLAKLCPLHSVTNKEQ